MNKFAPPYQWLEKFVIESNKIDPQPGFKNEVGDPRFDDHLDALKASIIFGNVGHTVDYCQLHRVLMSRMWEEIAGVRRDVAVRVGNHLCPEPTLIKSLMDDWDSEVMGQLLTGYKKTKQEKENSVWDLHIEFERIHPFRDGNGRTGRLLMVNHALILGLEPWIIEHKNVDKYYERFKE